MDKNQIGMQGVPQDSISVSSDHPKMMIK